MIRSLLVIAVLAVSQGAGAAPLAVNWTLVGNAGNAPDPQTGWGAVSYDFAISTTEVTKAQYVDFLNTVDPTGANALGLFEYYMSYEYGSVTKTGTTDGARYVVTPGRERHPLDGISFISAMRFVNWLHNGQGTGSTESGVYNIDNGLTETRSAGARYWIPSEDEWYKAAFHDVAAGTAGVYFDYATGSDAIPISDHPADNLAAVNYYRNDGIANGFNDGFALSGSTTNHGPDALTNVGAYSGAPSPYGTFDQNGSVWEWTELVLFETRRGLRGGSWISKLPNELDARGSRRGFSDPTPGGRTLGLRIAGVAELAAVPEPTGVIMMGLPVAWACLRMRRWHRQDRFSS